MFPYAEKRTGGASRRGNSDTHDTHPSCCVKFLLIDDNPDNRFLVSKTLLRKFPHAALVECAAPDTALALLQEEVFDIVLAHRTHELAGLELIRELRRACGAPIVAISGVDRRAAALEAGAARFHLLDEWLLIGNTVQELLAARESNQTEA
jgi:CheY-like chemotaxis protein